MTKGNKVVSMMDRQLAKGDLQGAIGMMINGCDSVSEIAEGAIAELEANEKRLTDLADKALAKYKLF